MLLGGIVVALCVAVLILALAGRWRRKRSGDVSADLPCAFGCKMAWVAVRTRDTAGLIELLNLSDARSESWSVGVSTVYSDRVALKRVFVTPPIDGWSHVVGLSLPHPMGDAFEDRCTPFLARLSRKFGHVTYYASLPELDYFAWAALRDGRLIRGFACSQEGVLWNRGVVSEAERSAGIKGFELRAVTGAADQIYAPLVDEGRVLELARLWSLDPTRLDLREDLEEGVGYLATAPAEWTAAETSRRAA